ALAYNRLFGATRRCRFCVGSTLENRTTYSPKEQVQGITSLLSVSASRCLTQVKRPSLGWCLKRQRHFYGRDSALRRRLPNARSHSYAPRLPNRATRHSKPE